MVYISHTNLPTLVGDNVPIILREQGSEPDIREVDEKHYRDFLEGKLEGDVLKCMNTKQIEDVTEMLRTIYALAETYGISHTELEESLGKKIAEEGGYSHRYLLVGIRQRAQNS